MRLGKELIGKPIYSQTDGRLLGSVKDIYLDPKVTRLSGVFIGQEGLFNRRSLLIPRDRVTVFGLDAVLADGPDAATDDSQLTDAVAWLRRADLQGREISTPGGTRVGTVGDVLFNEEAHVVGFSLSRVFVEGPIARNRTVMNEAVVDTGGVEGNMTVDLARAERQEAENVADSPSVGEH